MTNSPYSGDAEAPGPAIYLHSYTLRGYSLARALRKARDLGFDGIELWAGHYKLDQVEEVLRQAQPLARTLEVTVPVLNLSGEVIGDDPAQRAERVRRVGEVIRRCPEVGVRIVNGYAGFIILDRADWGKNGSAAAGDEHYERAAAAYRDLGSIAQASGVTLTLEVHMNTIHDTAASALRLLDMIGSPAVRVNLDPGNMYGTSTAEPALDAITLLAGRIAYMHLKNARRAADQPGGVDYHWDLVHGDLDVYSIVRAAYRSGFRGPYCIEYSGAGDRAAIARDDVSYLRGALAEAATDTQPDDGATNPLHQEPL